MTVHLNPQTTNNAVGPGVAIRPSTTVDLGLFVPPINLSIVVGPSTGTFVQWRQYRISPYNSASTYHIDTSELPQQQPLPKQIATDAGVIVGQTYEDAQGTFADGGQETFQWDTQVGLPDYIRLQTPVSGQGGFTDSDRALLTDVAQSTILDQVVDSFLTHEISNGPSGGTVSANLLAWVFAIIVRITAVPEELIPGTPDGDYWFNSLAVVRVFRGTDIWLRVPVHTSSKYINLANEGIEAAVSSILPVQWLEQMSVQVAFRTGVLGQVFLVGPS